MKKILSIIIALIVIAGCSDEFLDTENLTQKTSSNFPANIDEANQALTGIYTILPSFSAMSNILMLSELRSDDRFGGGGQNDRDPQAINVFRVTTENLHSNCWSNYYRGIFRCNTLLSSLDNVKWDSDESRKSIVGQTYFLRAYYYFDLARLFGPVPMPLNPEPENLPKAAPDVLYGQIASDLKNAIENLPDKPADYTQIGRASKWAAEALMARMFLFYTGYYQKSEITLPEDGGKITKDDVIAWVDDCVANSGHQLVDDFRNLWPYSISQEHYGYARDNDLHWVGDDGGNTEAIFQIAYAPVTSSNWSEQVWYSNQVDLYCGFRNSELQVPFGRGWGFMPVNPKLYEDWPNDDIRKQGSILNVNDESEGIEDEYVWGADMQWQETGFIGKKYIPINVVDNDAKVNYSVPMYGATTNFQINNTQNIIVIRLADVLLMGAELGSPSAQEYMDRVRARVGLPSVPVNLDNIKKERHYELAFEGQRYFDLLRWYGEDAGTVIKQNMNYAEIYNMTIKTTINADRNNGYFDQIDQRVKNTGGFLMIPNDEIELSKGVLEQNPGWVNSSNTMF